MRHYEIKDVPTTETVADGVRIGLGYADNPQQFGVGTDVTAGRSVLMIEVQYPTDTQEQRDYLTVGRARLFYGKHSKRLFAVRLDCGDAFSGTTTDETAIRTALQTVTKDLRTALDELVARNSNHGPRLNYKVVRAGLGLDPATAPPPWLIEAMKTLEHGTIKR